MVFVFAALLFVGSLAVRADVLADNTAKTSGGAETAAGTRWLTASFKSGEAASVLQSITLQLANPTAGRATLAIYADGF